MKGDFSRNTYEQRHHFARVLMQQGRVLIDADWNEQTSILLHYIRTLAVDLIGQHGGPGNGFEISCSGDADHAFDFVIGYGHYYVDGILCENEPFSYCPSGEAPVPMTYTTQPDFPLLENDDEARLSGNTSYLVYLDVWERHLNHLQADHIREPALGGPDTASRAQVVCQVKTVEITDDLQNETDCSRLVNALLPRRTLPCLRARARVEAATDDPCLIPPIARYRGAESQLYRVEIHDSDNEPGTTASASYKWSRDNGSVVFGIRSLQGSTLTLETLGPDERRSISENDWVEIVDDNSVLRFTSYGLYRVLTVDPVGFTVTVEVPGGTLLPVFDETSTTHPILRRWDQGSDVLPVEPGKWINLEDGVQVYFEAGGTYQTGDYWLIPARAAIGDLLWPDVTGPDGVSMPAAVRPRGIHHHRAPLRVISLDANGIVSCEEDCRCGFDPHCAAAQIQTPTLGVGDRPPGRFPVTEVRGVGETFAFRLGAADIIDARDLVRREPAELARILAPSRDRPIPIDRVERIIENARRFIEGVDDDETD
ncbi:MAG: DUF6519 domain-containing protein [Candidatus Thiodiazotropha sp.]